MARFVKPGALFTGAADDPCIPVQSAPTVYFGKLFPVLWKRFLEYFPHILASKRESSQAKGLSEKQKQNRAVSPCRFVRGFDRPAGAALYP